LTRLATSGFREQRLRYSSTGNILKDELLVPSSSLTLRRSHFTYDSRDTRLTIKDSIDGIDERTFVYSGLGHVTSSKHSSTRPCPSGCSFQNFRNEERPTYDAYGNILTMGRGDSIYVTGPSSFTGTFDGLSYTYNSAERLTTISGGTNTTTYTYDADGNVRFSVSSPPNNTGSRSDRYSFYGADNRLMAADYREGEHVEINPPQRVVEQYRYDPLGRRIWVRTDKRCDGRAYFTIEHLCELSTIRRTIWDGNAELMEIQTPNNQPGGVGFTDTIPDNDLYLPRLSRTPTAGQDPNPYLGRVLYINGLPLDQPLGIVRYNYVDYRTTTTYLDFPPTTIALHWDAKGTLGNVACSNGATFCTALRFSASTPDTMRIHVGNFWFAYARSSAIAPAFQGTLIVDKEDATKTIFRRNRVYDPASGRFTQEDPIGLVGGLNLHGFAGGDPVNFGDPFGLSPCWLISPSSCQDNAFTLALKRGWAAETEGFASAFDPSLAGPPAGGGVGWLLGMAAQRVGAGGAAEGGGMAAARGSSVNSRIINSVVDLGAEVKIGRTAKSAGEFVNIKFKDGTVVNFRVETHDPFGFHGNVDIWRPGQNPIKKHLFPGDK